MMTHQIASTNQSAPMGDGKICAANHVQPMLAKLILQRKAFLKTNSKPRETLLNIKS